MIWSVINLIAIVCIVQSIMILNNAKRIKNTERLFRMKGL